ncbi:MAG TPA: hypothetical protein ENK15_02150 [Thermopetrobacter sp.]|nr:hypothetical protein [Thermopetrobacter sp.]
MINDPTAIAADMLEQKRRHAALRYIVEAWEEAVCDGLHPQTLAQAALFAALSELVTTHGEDEVAKMAETLPERIRLGEFTLVQTRQ